MEGIQAELWSSSPAGRTSGGTVALVNTPEQSRPGARLPQTRSARGGLGAGGAPETVRSSPTLRVQGGAPAELGALLAHFGLNAPKDHERVEIALLEHAQGRGYHLELISLRHGRLVIEAAPTVAALLEYDMDALTARLENSAPGVVSEIKVRVRP